MSALPLHSPAHPINLIPGYILEEPQQLELRCRDQFFQDATINDESGKEAFRVRSEYGKSWSFRRSVYNAQGEHIFDLRHYALDIKNRWVIEDPSKNALGTMEHEHLITKEHSNVNLTLTQKDSDGKDMVVQMRQKDRSAITSYLIYQGTEVAEIDLIERNAKMFNEARGRDRSVWRIRVAPTMDLSIVVVMALCRAEMAHVWDQ